MYDAPRDATAPRPSRPTAELLQRYDQPGPRYTSYPTAVQFHDAFDEARYVAALERAAETTAPLSIYTHLPFCEARCLYCACNVVISPRKHVADPYLERLKREIDMVAPRLGASPASKRRVAQFHLGGGTPTYYAPHQLADLLQHYRSYFAFEPDAEVAVEVDPRVTTAEHLEVLAGEGFNRMSLGVQDFDIEVQQAVNRVQSVAETRALMERGRALGFASLNLDLIYGLPHQTPESFRRTLAQVVQLRPDRLAVYSFALVPWLKHHQKLMPQDALPTGLDKFELLAVARDELLAAGYRDIGMDHFALPGDDLSQAQEDGRLWRNFMGYTTRRLSDLVGFGVSAIGSVGGAYVQNVKKLSQYYEAVDAGRLPVERGYELAADDEVRRDVIQSWMCQFQIDKRRVEAEHDIEFDAYFAKELAELERLAAEGLVDLGMDEIRAGKIGRLFPRNVAMVFDAYLGSGNGAGPRFSRTV